MPTATADLIRLVDAARRLGLRPRTLSDALYQGRLDPSLLVEVGGVRFLRVTDLPAIKRALAATAKKKTA